MSGDKKTSYKGNTEAHRRGNAKYLKESVEDIRIRVQKGKKAEVQAHAAKQGESMNAFVVRAIKETMQRDNSESPGVDL